MIDGIQFRNPDIKQKKNIFDRNIFFLIKAREIKYIGLFRKLIKKNTKLKKYVYIFYIFFVYNEK